MINNIQPDSIDKEAFDNAMYNFCKKLTYNSHQYYIKTKMSYRPVYKSDGGRKFIKVKSFETKDSKGSIHCFVDKYTGDIYKPATWKAPYTKGENAVRGNIYDSSTFQDTDPHGGWLYQK